MNNNIVPKYVNQGLNATIIMVENDFGMPPTQWDCQSWMLQKGIQAGGNLTVLYDPTGAVGIYGGHQANWITNEHGLIVFKGHSDDLGQLESGLQQELAQ